MTTPQTVALSGSSGLIGRALAATLEQAGHSVRRLVRVPSNDPQTIFWDHHNQLLDNGLDTCNAVIHLAGETVDGRWTPVKKQSIRSSRVESTRFLAERILALPQPPQTFLCASAIGFYGSPRADVVQEDSDAGAGFLAEVVQEWEAATRPLEEAGIRVLRLRFGVVLSPAGGALKKLLPVFQVGLGGKLGSGLQRMSWVSLPDAVQVLSTALTDTRYQGVCNVVAPQFITNEEFTRALGKALRRPTLFPVPAKVLQLIFGEMANQTILSDLAVRPQQLTQWGFSYQHPQIDTALAALLQKKEPSS
jgi:uncharacterized protein (TIGR01777 family)